MRIYLGCNKILFFFDFVRIWDRGMLTRRTNEIIQDGLFSAKETIVHGVSRKMQSWFTLLRVMVKNGGFRWHFCQRSEIDSVQGSLCLEHAPHGLDP